MERSTDFGMELNPKQQRFVEEYLVDLNATQAAIRAGFSPSAARNQGYRMMTNDDIQNSIQAAMDARSQRTGITADRVLEELATIGFANIADYLDTDEDGRLSVNLSGMTREQAAAVKDVRIDNRDDGQSVHFRMSDKLSALIAMNRHLQKLPRAQKVHFVEIEAPPAVVEDRGPRALEDKVSAFFDSQGFPVTADRAPAAREDRDSVDEVREAGLPRIRLY